MIIGNTLFLVLDVVVVVVAVAFLGELLLLFFCEVVIVLPLIMIFE